MTRPLKFGLLTLACAMLVSCGDADSAATRAAEDAQIQALLDDPKPEATRPREPALISASLERVRREGDQLNLAIAGREPVRFTSNLWCPEMDLTEDNCVEYIFVADLQSHNAYVVEQTFYDSNDFVVVNTRSGEQTRVATPPQFSPDGERFIVVGFVLADGADPYALEIWRHEEGSAVSEWRLEHGDAALGRVASAKVVRWDGDRIAMEFDPGDGAAKWRGVLKKSGDSWQPVKD